MYRFNFELGFYLMRRHIRFDYRDILLFGKGTGDISTYKNIQSYIALNGAHFCDNVLNCTNISCFFASSLKYKLESKMSSCWNRCTCKTDSLICSPSLGVRCKKILDFTNRILYIFERCESSITWGLTPHATVWRRLLPGYSSFRCVLFICHLRCFVFLFHRQHSSM